MPAARYRFGPFYQLGIAVLLAFFALNALMLFCTFVEADRFLADRSQILNVQLAANIANTIQPFTLGDFHEPEVRQAVEEVRAVHSGLAVFLLDSNGRITWHAPESARLSRTVIALEPLLLFLQDSFSPAAARGDDPLFLNEETVFSAARIQSGGKPAFVYCTITPTGSSYFSSADGRWMLSLLMFPAHITATAVGCIILFLFIWYLSQQFRALVEAARSISQGDHRARARVFSQDTVGSLAASFNALADQMIAKEAELRSIEAQRQQLVAAVLHDLRAPLASLSGLLELCLDKDTTPGEEIKRLLATAARAASRQQQFFSKLTELSDVQVREASPQWEEVDLCEIVGQLVAMHGAQAGAKHIKVSLTVASPPSPERTLTGDVFLLERAISNILGNAISYTPENGSVRVQIQQTDNEAICTISDTGPGISKGELERIFTDYYRSAATAEANPGGTGLGLGIVQRIIALHGGILTVENAAMEGEIPSGTVFKLSLPLHAVAGQLLLRPEAAVESGEDLRQPAALPGGQATSHAYIWRHLANTVVFSILAAVHWRNPSPYFSIWLTTGTLLIAAKIAAARSMLRSDHGTQWPAVVDTYLGIALAGVIAGSLFLFTAESWQSEACAITAALIGFLGVTGITILKAGPTETIPSALLLAIALATGPIPYLPRYEVWLIGAGAGTALGLTVLLAFSKQMGQAFAARFSLPFTGVLFVFGLFSGYQGFLARQAMLQQAELEELRTIGPEVVRRLAPYSSPLLLPDAIERTLFVLGQSEASLDLLLRDAHGVIRAATASQVPGSPSSAVDVHAGTDICSRKQHHPFLLSFLPFSLQESVCVAMDLPVEQANGSLFLTKYTDETFVVDRNLETTSGWFLTAILAVTAILLGALLRIICFLRITKRINSLAEAVMEFQSGNFNPDAGLLAGINGAGNDGVRAAAHGDGITSVGLALKGMIETLIERQTKIQRADANRRQLITALVQNMREPQEQFNKRFAQLDDSVASLDIEARGTHMAALHAGAISQSKIVDELFYLMKLDVNEVRLERGDCSLREIFSAAMRYSTTENSLNRQKITLRIPEATPLVYADADMLLRAIRILIDELSTVRHNSALLEIDVTFTPSGAQVTLQKGLPGGEPPLAANKRPDCPDDQDGSTYAGASSFRLSIVTKLLELHDSELHIQGDQQSIVVNFTLPSVRNLSEDAGLPG